MAPEDRRAAIVVATIPLLRARGWSVTTKEIAAAARVSDGTIFSVFKDKEELLLAALQAALDPQPAVDHLTAIDLSLPLEERLIEAVEVLQRLVIQVRELSSILQLEQVRGRLPRHYSEDYFARKVLPALFEPSLGDLRVEPTVASQALWALATSGSSPGPYERPMPAAEIVALILHGVQKPRKVASTDGRARRKPDRA